MAKDWKMNAEKSIVIIGGKAVVVYSESVSVVSVERSAGSVRSTGCKKNIHTRYSGVRVNYNGQ